MSAYTDSYSESRMGRPYGFRSPVYTKGYHRAQDIRKTDPTGSYSVVTDVYSLSSGRVVNVYWRSMIGWAVVVDTGRKRGRYEIHCHMADVPAIGRQVTAGDRIGRNANRNERPGIIGVTWNGPHDHFIIGDHSDTADNASRPEYNPLPFIQDAMAQAAGGGPKPVPTPTPQERENRIMASGVFYNSDATGDDKRFGAIVDIESGFVSQFSWFDVAYADRIAVALGNEKAAGISSGQLTSLINDVAGLADRKYGK